MWSNLLRFLLACVLLTGFFLLPVSQAGASLRGQGLVAGQPGQQSDRFLLNTKILSAFAPHANNTIAVAHAEPEKERRLRRLLKREITRDIALKARVIVDKHHQEAFGTEIEFVSGGKNLVARIEQHFHPPGGEARPWGYHAGVSVLVAESNP